MQPQIKASGGTTVFGKWSILAVIEGAVYLHRRVELRVRRNSELFGKHHVVKTQNTALEFNLSLSDNIKRVRKMKKI